LFGGNDPYKPPYLSETPADPYILPSGQAITEPDAGSDVANLTCEAKLTEDGKHYIVNGEKKWITNVSELTFINLRDYLR